MSIQIQKMIKIQNPSAYVHNGMTLSKLLVYVDTRMSGFELACLQHIFFFPPSEWMLQQLNSLLK